MIRAKLALNLVNISLQQMDQKPQINLRRFVSKKAKPIYLIKFILYALILIVLLVLIYKKAVSNC